MIVDARTSLAEALESLAPLLTKDRWRAVDASKPLTITRAQRGFIRTIGDLAARLKLSRPPVEVHTGIDSKHPRVNQRDTIIFSAPGGEFFGFDHAVFEKGERGGAARTVRKALPREFLRRGADALTQWAIHLRRSPSQHQSMMASQRAYGEYLRRKRPRVAKGSFAAQACLAQWEADGIARRAAGGGRQARKRAGMLCAAAVSNAMQLVKFSRSDRAVAVQEVVGAFVRLSACLKQLDGLGEVPALLATWPAGKAVTFGNRAGESFLEVGWRFCESIKQGAQIGGQEGARTSLEGMAPAMVAPPDDKVRAWAKGVVHELGHLTIPASQVWPNVASIHRDEDAFQLGLEAEWRAAAGEHLNWARQKELVEAAETVLDKGALNKGWLSRACSKGVLQTNGERGRNLRVELEGFLGWFSEHADVDDEALQQVRQEVIALRQQFMSRSDREQVARK